MSQDRDWGHYIQYHGRVQFFPSVDVGNTRVTHGHELRGVRDGQPAWTVKSPTGTELVQPVEPASSVLLIRPGYEEMFTRPGDEGTDRLYQYDEAGTMGWELDVPSVASSWKENLFLCADGDVVFLDGKHDLHWLSGDGRLDSQGSISVDPLATELIGQGLVATVRNGSLELLGRHLQVEKSFRPSSNLVSAFCFSAGIFIATDGQGSFWLLEDQLDLIAEIRMDPGLEIEEAEMAVLPGRIIVSLKQATELGTSTLLLLDESGRELQRISDMRPAAGLKLEKQSLLPEQMYAAEYARPVPLQQSLIVDNERQRLLILRNGRICCLDFDGTICWEYGEERMHYSLDLCGSANDGNTLILLARTGQQLISIDWDGRLNFVDSTMTDAAVVVGDAAQIWMDSRDFFVSSVGNEIRGSFYRPIERSQVCQVVGDRTFVHGFEVTAPLLLAGLDIFANYLPSSDCCRHRIYDMDGQVVYEAYLPLDNTPWQSDWEMNNGTNGNSVQMVMTSPGWQTNTESKMLLSMIGLHGIRLQPDDGEGDQIFSVELEPRWTGAID